MDFGIEIPVMDSRASETFARLSSHPHLAARREAWHINALWGPIDREDLLRVHSADYVSRLFSAGLEAEIIRTYELDELPSTAGLKLSLEQLLERDQLVYSFLKSRGIPGAWVMAGGYGRNSWRVYTQFLEWALLERLGG